MKYPAVFFKYFKIPKTVVLALKEYEKTSTMKDIDIKRGMMFQVSIGGSLNKIFVQMEKLLRAS